jgi:uncharacterized membrane protein
MHPSPLHYFPLTPPYTLGLLLLLALVVALVQLHVLAFAYERLGVHPRYVMAVLLLSLLGSAVNIPIAQLPEEKIVENQVVSFAGMQYVVPFVQMWPGTIIAINVGGAVLPTLLSIYLIFKHRLLLRGLIGVALVAQVVHQFAYPVPGVGIATPTLAPPLLAAGVGVLLGWQSAAPLAYVAGCLGTLIGADLTNLDAIRGLGAPVASIGGAGTYDGIFVTGILAVLLTWGPTPQPPATGDSDPTAITNGAKKTS